MATREISIERQVIREHRQMIVDRIATSVSALWLSQKLQQEDFISPERASDIFNTLGISSGVKVSQMMEAVESKIKYDPSQFFGKFVAIVESEPALEDVRKALDDCYQLKSVLSDGDKNPEAQPPQDEDDDTDLDKDHEGQVLLPRREKEDKDGQPFIYSVCCSFPVAAIIVVAAMTTAFIALNYNDSEIERSSEYPEDRKALSIRAVFDFLWIISPPSVIFAVAITTYCTCSRTFLKQTHWFHFFNLMAICYYGVAMLLLLVRKPLKGDDHFGIPKYRLECFYTMHIGMLFFGAAVFVHPGSIQCWIVMAIASIGVTLFSLLIALIYNVTVYVAVSNDAPPSVYRTDSNDAPPLSALTNFVKILLQELIFVIGIALAVCVELCFMFQALSLTRIETLTEAKRYVLFVIILLLYTCYCIYGIYEGLEDLVLAVFAIMLSFTCSTMFKVAWEL